MKDICRSEKLRRLSFRGKLVISCFGFSLMTNIITLSLYPAVPTPAELNMLALN